MIINSAPKNEAILSNVAKIGEFRIQQSAASFQILSSGLYANKIRAVIRELSCNAIDSHMSAGKRNTPFDVHLPNFLEPWFAVRDYGTGLDHDQISQIYTTYFLSTKGDSNDQIGGLGLGSKSPFSYTDNFTVTTSKEGVKGIYTAFINEHGVPSIVLMETSNTTDPNGVEVKFSVNNRYDFGKFEQEARYVFQTFELLPVVSGAAHFEFNKTNYQEKDIIPGVHYLSGARSCAVMGNVHYPIDVPNSQANLGDLTSLLACGLELNFAIGEIKFQASREGLSYVPETIAAIKTKLEALRAVLAVKVAVEAGAITCMYDRQVYLKKKHGMDLFTTAVNKYATDTQFPLMNLSNIHGRYFRPRSFRFDVATLEKQYNIKITAFSKNSYYTTTATVNPQWEYNNTLQAPGVPTPRIEYWQITADPQMNIIINDTVVGAIERAKYHWKTAVKVQSNDTQYIYVLTKADKTKGMDTASFLNELYSPPAVQVLKASALSRRARATPANTGPVTLLKLEDRGGRNGNTYRDKVWRPAGDLSTKDATAVYYFMPVSGFVTQSKFALTGDQKFREVDITRFMDDLEKAGIPGTCNCTVYGVRKADLATVTAKKNWVNLEDLIVEKLSLLDDKFWLGMIRYHFERFTFINFDPAIKLSIVNKDSTFLQVYSQFDGSRKESSQLSYLTRLLQIYLPTAVLPFNALSLRIAKDCEVVCSKYPLLVHLDMYSSKSNNGLTAIAEYINLVDAK